MSIYGNLDPMPEHRTQIAFKCKREHKAKVNTGILRIQTNIFIFEMPNGSRDYVAVADT